MARQPNTHEAKPGKHESPALPALATGGQDQADPQLNADPSCQQMGCGHARRCTAQPPRRSPEPGSTLAVPFLPHSPQLLPGRQGVGRGALASEPRSGREHAVPERAEPRGPLWHMASHGGPGVPGREPVSHSPLPPPPAPKRGALSTPAY